jgi:hypothetical protein
MRAWEAARAKAVHAATASAEEAAAVREKVEASIKEAEAWATLAKREARERVLTVEAESVTSLAFVCGEANKLA